jgi:hypothetical protein
MSFSAELLELAKDKLGFTKDAQLLEIIPNTTKGNLSQIKSGNRDLTDAQALAIAEHCGFNKEWVLVSLAADTTKSEAAKSVWSTLAKKLLTGALMLCVLKISGSYLVPDLGKHRFLARSRLFA